MTLVQLPASLSIPERGLVRGLDPIMQERAVAHIAALAREGIGIRFNSGRRTPKEQERIRKKVAAGGAKGLTGFVAKGRSFHLDGLAYDAEPVPKNNATWVRYGVTAERLGLVWGGRFRRKVNGKVVTDRPHVQAPTLGVKKPLATLGIFIVGTAAVAGLARRVIDK